MGRSILATETLIWLLSIISMLHGYSKLVPSHVSGSSGGTGTSRVRLGNVPNMCDVNPGRQDSPGTGFVQRKRRLGNVSAETRRIHLTFCVKKCKKLNHICF